MKVILLQDIKDCGKQEEIVTVSDGYARNYLFPRKLAVEAIGGALKNLEIKKANEQRRSDKILQKAQQDKDALEGKSVTIHAKSGAGKLYGRVTAQDIAESISSVLGVSIDKRKVSLLDPIKELGQYSVPVKLHRDITVNVAVNVLAAE